MTRQRKPRINLIGYSNSHGVVVRTESADKWIIQCVHCDQEHEQSTRQIRSDAKSRQCSQYKPHNWTGFEREDAIIRRQYGISMQEFDELLEFQKHGCAICSKPIEKLSRRMNIDHDHHTNEVRGLLCSGCNTGLGQLGDTVEGLKRALKYLENPSFNQYANAR